MSKVRLAFLGILLLISCKPAQTPSTATTATVPTATIATTGTTTTSPQPPHFRLDHYKFWKVQPRNDKPLGEIVLLQGQFDKEKPWKAKIGLPQFIANPVLKTRPDYPEPKIQNERLHYVAYAIEPQPDLPLPPAIEVTNQFGTHRPWKLGRPAWLLVPADKVLKGKPGEPPKGDHFVCYAAEGQQAQIAVTLEDQIDKEMKRTEKLRDFPPAYFCVPVTKRRNDKPGEPILDRDTHLAIYRIGDDMKYDKPVWTNDQFGAQELHVLNAQYLALPTLKFVVPPPK